MRLAIVLAAACVLAPLAAQAQGAMPAAPTACPATPTPLPAGLEAWATPAPLTAAKTSAYTSDAKLKIGQAFDAVLPGTPEITYALRPEKPGGSVSYGGLFSVDVTKAGTYTIALSTGAWIDVVRDGRSLQSTGHGRGPACTTLRKMVAFPLEPGRYVIQIAANGEPKIGIMVAERP